jgi:glycosyltransferase involved in cell wall biosynthesis
VQTNGENLFVKRPLRIAINTQLPSKSGAGGIETVLRILTQLNQFGDEEFVFIGHHSDSAWLAELLGERQTLVRAPQPRRQIGRAERLKNLIGPMRPFARTVKNLVVGEPKKILPSVPVSDGFWESLNCDVVHFPYQDYVYCQLPTIYNPHDLQHLHYPQFFALEEFERREIVYPAACRAADAVIVASNFVKKDVAESYGVASKKIHVIEWSPPEIEEIKFSENEAKEIFAKYECPPRPFTLYPAMSWEHKNHLRLIEAIHLLRERDGIKLNLICTGHRTSFFDESIETRLRELNLENQIRFTGIVEHRELSVLYRTAQFVVVPTLFEAASAPLFEAWQHGAPVACSAVTSLPEQAGEAALLFNPLSLEAIADALKAFSSDENLRVRYRERGFRRLQDFSLERTAKSYLDVYRQCAELKSVD